ncbi:MAG: class A beta-lactamase, subclass A2 [Bacteroidetes bacterium]|nr:class A beta-lactamase, subclass A2 [Bacteroidota bacterium]
MTNKVNNIFWIIIILICSRMAFAQPESSRKKIAGIIERAKGRIGVAIEGLQSNDTLTFNDNEHYPMQSVFKFPVALTVLREIDKGKFSLDQKIHLKKKDLRPNTWSPLRKKYPNGNVDITLRELLTYTVSESDNNGCDILLRLVGGTSKVNQFVHNLGISEMQITETEEEMHKDWSVQYKNWTTPYAMAQLLCKFTSDSILSATSQNFLWNVMASTVTGSGRIKGHLPAGTIVAHKTGTSDTNDKGITAATNDVGVVTLPNGRHFAIVVLVSDSPEDDNARNEIIANIAKAAWDGFSTH